MIYSRQDFETTAIAPIPYKNIRIKCLLENGVVARHNVSGNIGDLHTILDELEGKALEIQFISRNAMKQRQEENDN